jgi:hypothetical protein
LGQALGVLVDVGDRRRARRLAAVQVREGVAGDLVPGVVQTASVRAGGEAAHRPIAPGQASSEIVGAAQATRLQRLGAGLAGGGGGVVEAERDHRPVQRHLGRPAIGKTDQPAAQLAPQAAIGLVGVDLLERSLHQTASI